MLKGLKQLNLPEIEQEVLEFWRKNEIFKKSLKKTSKSFIFYEGPPTANGRPGLHHVLARVFKDIICRYKTMRGFHVARRAGWDTQGLPVEIEVEKQLGIKNKQDIEKYGIAEFNKKAKESVWKYKDEWEKLTERIGFWLDFKNAYITYENSYLEKLWGIFGAIHKRGLLKKFYKVVPWCPRCQTSLSSHELGQPGAYKKITDPSVYVKFKVVLRQAQDKPTKTPEFLLVWTTTPWTLPANVAIAVNPSLTYTKFKIGNEYLWSAITPPFSPETKIEVMEKISGGKLVGWEYEPLYKNKGIHKVLAADFVSAEEGTGLVHIAPAFGEDDLNLMKDKMAHQDIPVTVNDRSLITAEVPGKGKFIKEADKDILEDLKNRGLLYHQTTIEHDYPFCWRCGTALIYFARDSWFIEMSKLRNDLVEENKKINWIPEHLKEGRFGEWIKEVKDWAISRERYWGTPLPIWECAKCEERLVIENLGDLNKYAFYKNNFYIMRHGEADHNLENKIACSDGDGRQSLLTEKGKKQVAKAATVLKNKKIDIIYASPFKRIKETVAIIKKEINVPVHYDERLKEIDCGEFDWRPIKEYHKFFANIEEKFATKTPGGESRNDVKKRTMKFIQEANNKHEGKTILIVSHADPLWLLEVGLNNVSDEEAVRWVNLEPAELRETKFKNWPYDDNGNLDLHRPYIDEISLKCSQCQSLMKRVKEVADVWFDSGGMPFAFGEHDAKRYPADYICEAIDQTRGWFYTLLAIAVLLKKGRPYKNVISLGHLLDKNGQKMSKSKGNMIDPWAMVNQYGVDVVRWYFYTVNPPGEPKRFDETDLIKVRNKFHNLLYNSYVFFSTYGNLTPKTNLLISDIHILDQWIIARLNQTINQSTKFLEKYEIGEAAKVIEVLVDDLSRWYIRRSRKRPEALPVLNFILLEISKLIAPFVPFFGEALYSSLNAKGKLLSVHLENWPKPNKKLIDSKLIDQMAEVRHLASLALAKRAEAKIKVRQPLNRLKIKDLRLKNDELLEVLKEEVNVKEIIFDKNIKDEIELDTAITPELKKEGLRRELIRMVQDLRHGSGCRPGELVVLMMAIDSELKKALDDLNKFKLEVAAKEIIFERIKTFDFEKSEKLDNKDIWLALKRR